MDWSADKLSAATKNPLPLGMGSVKELQTKEKIPLLPVIEPVPDNIEEIVELAEKVGITVAPEHVSARLELYKDDEETLSCLTFTPYYNVRALALFGVLLAGGKYNTAELYSLGFCDISAQSDFILNWMAEKAQIEITEDMSDIDVISILMSIFMETEVSFHSFSESEIDNGTVETCLNFAMLQEVFHAIPVSTENESN